MVDISIYILWFINQLITGGHHLVQTFLGTATDVVLPHPRKIQGPDTSKEREGSRDCKQRSQNCHLAMPCGHGGQMLVPNGWVFSGDISRKPMVF